MIKKILKEKMNEGFSLVELVMVMVILGILSAVLLMDVLSTVLHPIEYSDLSSMIDRSDSIMLKR